MAPLQRPSMMQRLVRQETPPRWTLATALFFVSGYVVFWIAGQFIAFTLRGDPSDSGIASMLLIGAALGNVAMALAVFQWARVQFPTTWADDLRLRQPFNPPVFFVVLFGLAVAWALDLLAILLRLKGDALVPPILAVLASPVGPLWVAGAAFAVLFQPVGEGLVFYGLLYPCLAANFKNNLLAVVAVAAIYAALNMLIFNPGATAWFGLIEPFVMALAVGLIRAYSGATHSAIVARAFFGVFFVLAGLIGGRL